MKEQDAAHSFDDGSEVPYSQLLQTCQELQNENEDNKKIIRNRNSELTRLRSELQQERELRKELVKGMEWAASQMAVNVPSTQSSLYARWVGCRENLESLIKKAKL